MAGLSFAWFRKREVFCPLVLFPLIFSSRLLHHGLLKPPTGIPSIPSSSFSPRSARNGLYRRSPAWTRRATRPERSRRESIVSLLQPSERSDSLALTAECLQSPHRAGWTAIAAAASRFTRHSHPFLGNGVFDGSCFAGAGRNEGAISVRRLFASVNSVRNFVPLRYILLVAMFRDDAAFAEPEV